MKFSLLLAIFVDIFVATFVEQVLFFDYRSSQCKMSPKQQRQVTRRSTAIDLGVFWVQIGSFLGSEIFLAGAIEITFFVVECHYRFSTRFMSHAANT